MRPHRTIFAKGSCEVHCRKLQEANTSTWGNIFGGARGAGHRVILQIPTQLGDISPDPTVCGPTWVTGSPVELTEEIQKLANGLGDILKMTTPKD